jgi:hypothetical protein
MIAPAFTSVDYRNRRTVFRRNGRNNKREHQGAAVLYSDRPPMILFTGLVYYGEPDIEG